MTWTQKHGLHLCKRCPFPTTGHPAERRRGGEPAARLLPRHQVKSEATCVVARPCDPGGNRLALPTPVSYFPPGRAGLASSSCTCGPARRGRGGAKFPSLHLAAKVSRFPGEPPKPRVSPRQFSARPAGPGARAWRSTVLTLPRGLTQKTPQLAGTRPPCPRFQGEQGSGSPASRFTQSL